MVVLGQWTERKRSYTIVNHCKKFMNPDCEHSYVQLHGNLSAKLALGNVLEKIYCGGIVAPDADKAMFTVLCSPKAISTLKASLAPFLTMTFSAHPR